jgi:uncharacterized protein YhbP (UPF0306 family)
MDIKARIKEVLNRGYLLSLGTQDDGGVWVADVIYTYDDDLNIYWMSLPQTRHSQAIEKNGQAAGAITLTSYGEKPELGIQFAGSVQKAETIPPEAVAKYFLKQGDEVPEEGEDVLGEHSWYVLRPTKIDLNDTENFGWHKKKLEL